MAKSKLIEANKKIEEKVVGAYKAVENGVVGAYKKVEDKFVDSFLTKDGETVEDAKERMAAEQKARGESAPTDGKSIGAASLEASRKIAEASRNAGKHN